MLHILKLADRFQMKVSFYLFFLDLLRLQTFKKYARLYLMLVRPGSLAEASHQVEEFRCCSVLDHGRSIQTRRAQSTVFQSELFIWKTRCSKKNVFV